ncbi:hypothetical protein AGMMS49574_02350 [Bacteroidia bacterium]|nr:hypothetical protein AGMMS49574_02350 [Bacteroidia bacterium]
MIPPAGCLTKGHKSKYMEQKNKTVKTGLILLTALLFTGCITTGRHRQTAAIPVRWASHLDGDFSFSEKWSYGEWIFKNQFGQLVCDGWCPPGTEAMHDTDGRIIEDSLTAYYQLVDTTHYYYTMTTNDPQTPDTLWHTQAERSGHDTVTCYTDMYGGAYTTMHIQIIKNRCFPLIQLISPEPDGDRVFPCTGGSFAIDQTCWQQGILKAAYQFTFLDSAINQAFTRKGKIYAKIEDKSS